MRTNPGIVMLLASAALTLSAACKAQETSSDNEATSDKPPVADPVQPEPAPVPDAQGPAIVGETPTTLLDTKGSTEALWTVTDTDIRFRAAFAKGGEAAAKRDATVYATVGETKEAEVFSCKAMLIAGEPRVDVLLRGDHMHVLCINPPQGENPGFTDAKRVTFEQAKMALTETGSYGGEGLVDPDTIDLDEGE